MPGTKEPQDNNSFSFEIGKVLFLSHNLYRATVIREEDETLNFNKVYSLFTEKRKNSSAEWVIFFSHVPNYCSQIDRVKSSSALDPFLLKKYEDLLSKINYAVVVYEGNYPYGKGSSMTSGISQKLKGIRGCSVAEYSTVASFTSEERKELAK